MFVKQWIISLARALRYQIVNQFDTFLLQRTKSFVRISEKFELSRLRTDRCWLKTISMNLGLLSSDQNSSSLSISSNIFLEQVSLQLCN